MDHKELLKSACKKFGNKESYKIARFYNKNGVQFFEDDVELLSPGEILYLAIKGIVLIHNSGEEFNFSAIMDDYDVLGELGKGGFGAVMLAKHIETKKDVAVKYMDCSENSKAKDN